MLITGQPGSSPVTRVSPPKASTPRTPGGRPSRQELVAAADQARAAADQARAVAAVLDRVAASSGSSEGSPLLIHSASFKLNKYWYGLYAVPVIALGLQAFLVRHTLRHAEKAPLNWFSSDTASAFVGGVSELGPVLFGLRTLHRFFLQAQLDPETTRKQLHPWKPVLLTLTGLVSMMYMVETIINTGFLADATKEVPPLKIFLAAVTVLSAVITNTINLFMKSKQADCPRMANYQSLMHKRYLASEDKVVAATINAILNLNTIDDQEKISRILLVRTTSAADLSSVGQKKWSFESSYLVWAVFFGFAFFQYGPPGPKAWHCLASGLDNTACGETITLDAYLQLQDFGYGLGAVMGITSTAANSYIWRRTASQVQDAWEHADGISRAAALLFLGFSMLLTYAQVTANEPLKSAAGDQVIGIILPLLSGGLSFISYMGVFNTDSFRAFTKKIRVGCGIAAAPDETQQSVMQKMSELLERAEAEPEMLVAAAPSMGAA